MKIVILAGGYGKRLRPLTEEVPKPLIKIGEKPIIVWQMKWFSSFGFDEFIILAGYKKEKIIDEIGSGMRYGVKISYIVEEELLGTGGAIKNAEHVLKKEDFFIVVNGDIITNLDPRRLIEELNRGDGLIGVIASVPLRSPYGILKIDEGSYIIDFAEKPLIKDYMINAGVYAFKPEIFRYLPRSGDLEKLVFPQLARERRLKAVTYSDVYWRSIDSIKDLEEAGKEIREVFKNIA